MSEKQAPIYHISGTISHDDYKTALRSSGLKQSIRISAFYLLLMLLYDIIFSVYRLFPYIKSGEITFGEWFEVFKLTLTIKEVLFIVIAFCAVFFFLNLVIRPARALKRVRELYPTGIAMVYDLYEAELEANSSSRMNTQTAHLNYSDVTRRIRENKYTIRLSTKHKNTLTLFKCIMTPEEAQGISALLRERCPQKKG